MSIRRQGLNQSLRETNLVSVPDDDLETDDNLETDTSETDEVEDSDEEAGLAVDDEASTQETEAIETNPESNPIDALSLSTHLSESGLNVLLYTNFIPLSMARDLRAQIYETINFVDYRRTAALFGDSGLIYRTGYDESTSATKPSGTKTKTKVNSSSTSSNKSSKSSGRKVAPWDELPGLKELKDCVELVANQAFNVAIIQCYPNGRIGINPHRDREISEGIIAGLTLYPVKPKPVRERVLRFGRGERQIELPLPNTSLYLMCPPTNRIWSHSITKDPSITTDRLSITFRYIDP